MHKERLITIELPWEWKKQMYFTPATDEQFIVKEVLIDECYQFDFKPTDIVLNLWGNIWAFEVTYHDRVNSIITFEPDWEAFNKLHRHLELNNIENVIAINLAVSYFDWELPFTDKELKGHNWYDENWTRKVSCIDINTVLNIHKPNKIKCDIEGFEYDLFDNFNIPDYVDEIWLETHTWSAELKERHNKLKKQLKDSWFEVTEIKNDEEDRTYLLRAKKLNFTN